VPIDWRLEDWRSGGDQACRRATGNVPSFSVPARAPALRPSRAATSGGAPACGCKRWQTR